MEAFACEGAFNGVAEEVPSRAGFEVDYFAVGEAEGEHSAFDVRREDAGSSDGAPNGVFS